MGPRDLARQPGPPSPKNFKDVLDRLKFVRSLGLAEDAGKGVHHSRLSRLAREGAKTTPQHLRRFDPLRRGATLVAYLSERAAEGEIDRRYYELSALSELKNGLRSGDVWVPGSRRYRDFDDYLVPKEDFAGMLWSPPPTRSAAMASRTADGSLRRHGWPYKIWVRPTGRTITAHILAVQNSQNGTATR